MTFPTTFTSQVSCASAPADKPPPRLLIPAMTHKDSAANFGSVGLYLWYDMHLNGVSSTTNILTQDHLWKAQAN